MSTAHATEASAARVPSGNLQRLMALAVECCDRPGPPGLPPGCGRRDVAPCWAGKRERDF